MSRLHIQRPFALSFAFLPHARALIRARVAIACGFFLQGFVFATWCARIPDIKTALALNEAQLGTLLLMAPLGQFLSMVPGGLCVTRFGSRTIALLAGISYPFVLAGLALAPTPWALGLFLFLMGVVSNLSYTAINTQGVTLEHHYRRNILSLFHGMWSIAGATAALLAIGLGILHVSVKFHLIGVALFCVGLVLFYGGALLLNDRKLPPKPPLGNDTSNIKAEPVTPNRTNNTSALRRPHTACYNFLSRYAELILLGIAAFGCMACEGTLYDWSGVYLREAAGIPESLQNVGYFSHLIVMVVIRLVTDKLTDRMGHRPLLIFSGFAIALGYMVAVLAPSLHTLSTHSLPLVLCATALGMAFIGLGSAIVVPLCCSLAGKSKTLAPGMAITTISTIGAFGFLLSPPLIGYLAHLFNLRIAFLTMVALGLLVSIAALGATKRRTHP